MAEGNEISILKRSLYSCIHWGIIHHSRDMDVNQVNGEEWLRNEKCVCVWVWVWVSVSVRVCVCVWVYEWLSVWVCECERVCVSV